MTSFAFILGVLPLVLATGAGASARISIGIAVFYGMIASTCLVVVFVPSFYVVMQRLDEGRSRKPAPEAKAAEARRRRAARASRPGARLSLATTGFAGEPMISRGYASFRELAQGLGEPFAAISPRSVNHVSHVAPRISEG